MNIARLCSVGLWIPGKGTEVLQNFQKFRVRYESITELTEVPGTGTEVLQNSQKVQAGTKNAVPVPRVLWHGAYRTHRSSRYGYECPTELIEVPGTGMKVLQNFQKFRALWHEGTELTEVPGRCKNFLPVPRVFWHGRTDLK